MSPAPLARRRARRRSGSAPSRERFTTDERRNQLVELGLRTFSKRAYDEVSIDDLAAAAGISKGLLYHYFPTKRDFYVASVRESAHRLLAISNVPDGGEPAVERLRASVDAYLDYAARNQRSYVALLRAGVGADPEMVEVLEATRREFLRRLLRGAHDHSPDPRARVVLRGWVGFVEAVSLDWLEHRDPPRTEVSELLVRVLMSEMQLAPDGSWQPRTATPRAS